MNILGLIVVTITLLLIFLVVLLALDALNGVERSRFYTYTVVTSLGFFVFLSFALYVTYSGV